MQYSTSASSAQGGDIGFISEVPFPQMASPLLALDEGGVSGVFNGPDGYYIVKLEEKKGGEQIDFDAIKEEIVQNQLLIKQQQAILYYIERLKQTTKVETNKELLE
jgi:parvulin-like peptidyl-prolyl isomerase